jgi:hypothetical protein
MVVDNIRLVMAIAYSVKIGDRLAIFDATLINALAAMPENHRDLSPSAAIR